MSENLKHIIVAHLDSTRWIELLAFSMYVKIVQQTTKMLCLSP